MTKREHVVEEVSHMTCCSNAFDIRELADAIQG